MVRIIYMGVDPAARQIYLRYGDTTSRKNQTQIGFSGRVKKCDSIETWVKSKSGLLTFSLLDKRILYQKRKMDNLTKYKRHLLYVVSTYSKVCSISGHRIISAPTIPGRIGQWMVGMWFYKVELQLLLGGIFNTLCEERFSNLCCFCRCWELKSLPMRKGGLNCQLWHLLASLSVTGRLQATLEELYVSFSKRICEP